MKPLGKLAARRQAICDQLVEYHAKHYGHILTCRYDPDYRCFILEGPSGYYLYSPQFARLQLAGKMAK